MPIDTLILDQRTGPKQTSRLLDSLPAIFQEGPDLGRLLMAFESIFLGLPRTDNVAANTASGEWKALLNSLDPNAGGSTDPNDVPPLGFEEVLGGVKDQTDGHKLLDGIERYFEPGVRADSHGSTPADFLPWLAGWVSLTLRDDWKHPFQRAFIAQAVWLYRLRGTKDGLVEFIRIFTGGQPTISELTSGFQIGVHSQVGVDTALEGGKPFFFKVTLPLAAVDPKEFKQKREIATAIIQMQKPAHTTFSLVVTTPQFQIAKQSRVGVDTWLSLPPQAGSPS